jgi:hypothetical protein
MGARPLHTHFTFIHLHNLVAKKQVTNQLINCSSHQKYIFKSKKAPLRPQVHAADIPQDSRTHMDKKAKIS